MELLNLCLLCMLFGIVLNEIITSFNFKSLKTRILGVIKWIKN